ncbi:MAG TPA: carboxypeptidase regulatory-like domain-containing protein [Bacteroidales bacterium]|nr:carboxypeptidase regulatory-like domain-containing protein [Bacteroidales bacterium]
MSYFHRFLMVFVLMMAIDGYSQDYKVESIITDPEMGQKVVTKMVDKLPPVDDSFTIEGFDRSPEINWQFSDPVSIGSSVRVSKQEETTLVAWWLNNERASLYSNSPVPIWENPVTSDFEFAIDMTPNGLYLALGYGNMIQVYATATQALVWEKATDASVTSVKISEDGTMVYALENSPGGQDKSSVKAYEVGQEDPVWATTFSGTGVAFAASGDRSKFAFCQYPGANKMHILDGLTGEVIFDAFYRNQNPPSFSYDGKLIISGDYGGYAYLHEYDDNTGTYFEKWNFKVGGGGTSAWVIGVDLSDDGSTVAIGTLVFLSSDYNGEIYLFNTYSNEPLWVYQNCGDEITSISISEDGSLIAAAGWGPMDNTKPDFMLFRKESSVPLFTINTPGSFNSVDLSPDGTLCSVTGKAVHARVLGSGGLLYNINSNPGGGSVAGTVVLDGASTFENVKVQVEGIDDYYDYTDTEGNFEIKYVPAGTYNVVASKVGYYPEEQTGIIVTEGGTSNVNFSLLPTGNPPENLMATKGADYSVLLSWDHPNPSATSGFNIYRKSHEQALFPETPIATVLNSELEFEDEDVKPVITYYYAVTAVLDGGAQSPYSNIDQGWMASGFVINEISVYTGTTPTIDGTLSPGEWDDAFVMDASDFFGTYDNNPNPMGSVTMFFKVNEGMTEMYVACIDENKTVLQDNFTVSLYIDDNNDGSFPPAEEDFEGNYWARYFAAGNVITYRPIYNTGGVGQNLNLVDPQVEASDATGFVVMELVIPMGDDEVWKLNPNEFNQSGMMMFTTNFDGYWPALNQQIFYPLTYGTLTFGADNEIPPAPDELDIWWDSATAPVLIKMEWAQPDINDFDHFNLYINEGSGFTLLTETIGRQVFYITDNTDYTLFYVTTVDKAGQESEPSENMIFDVTTFVTEVESAANLQIYPNPVSADANIMIKVVNEGEYNISVLDINGRIVQNLFSGQLNCGVQSFVWNGTDNQGNALLPGVYFIRVSSSEDYLIKKMIRIK